MAKACKSQFPDVLHKRGAKLLCTSLTLLFQQLKVHLTVPLPFEIKLKQT